MLFNILYDISKYIPVLHNGLEFRLCNKQTNKSWELHKHKDVIQLSNDKYIDIQIIEFMKKYKYLYFHIKFRNISNEQLTSIPTSFENLQNLQHLDLYNNQLTSIPTSLGNLQNLQNLSLGSNRLTSIPSILGNLQNLKIYR